MELLTEFAFILKKKFPKSTDLGLPKKSKMRKLYNAILKGKVKNDRDAALFIYKSEAQDKKYLMLKRNIINKLAEQILLSEHFESNIDELRFSSLNELIIAEKLLLQNVYHNADKMALKIYAFAQKRHLTEIKCESLRILRSIYSLKGYAEETARFDSLLQEATVLRQLELETKGVLEVLLSQQKFSLSRPALWFEKPLKQIHYLENFTGETSPTLRLYQYRLGILCANTPDKETDKQRYFTLLDELLSSWSTLKSHRLQIETGVEKIRFLIFKHKLDEALNDIDALLKITDYEAFDKFEVQALHFEARLKNAEYLQAAKILKEVVSQERYTWLDERDKAIWKLRQICLYLVYRKLGKKRTAKKFAEAIDRSSVSTILNDVQALNKDKQGYHLISQIFKLFILKEKGVDDLTSEANTLSVYVQRYLRDYPYARTVRFVKILIKACKNGYAEKNPEFSPAGFDPCELIPYEVLTDMLRGDTELLLTNPVF